MIEQYMIDGEMQEGQPLLNKAISMLQCVVRYEALTDIQKSILEFEALKEDPFFPNLKSIVEASTR